MGRDHAKVALVIWSASGGWLMTPDLDVNGTTFEEYRLYKIFWPIGFVWQNFWAPYGLMFKHRGWSHTPFIGTLTRIAYILGVLICGSFLANQMIVIFDFKTNVEFSASFATVFIRDNWSLCIAWYIVWAIQDIGHWVADVLSTAAKREARQAIRKGERW